MEIQIEEGLQEIQYCMAILEIIFFLRGILQYAECRTSNALFVCI